MSKHFISALLDLKEHFPDMAWYVDADSVLHIKAPLDSEQDLFLRQAQQMFEPVANDYPYGDCDMCGEALNSDGRCPMEDPR